MSSVECKKCGEDYPSIRRKIAKYFPNLCIDCANDVDYLIEIPYFEDNSKFSYQMKFIRKEEFWNGRRNLFIYR